MGLLDELLGDRLAGEAGERFEEGADGDRFEAEAGEAGERFEGAAGELTIFVSLLL